ncbi:hypothetical protein LJC57_03160 [Parabacteroides sp. OttesenSCG-928-G07]|nr:hypothetical protein [Parabacteroides sp. OttesenSCG-928-G07]
MKKTTFLLLLLTFFSVGQLTAETRQVPDALALKSAIEDTNVDTIEIAGGTLRLIESLIIPERRQLVIRGAGMNQTILDADYIPKSNDAAQPNQGLFRISLEATITLEGMTLKNGGGFSLDGPFFGGGIYNEGELTLIDCLLEDNMAEFGGGILNLGTLTLYNSILRRNESANGGGGIKSYNTTLLINCLLTENNGYGKGGAIDIQPDGIVTLVNCTVTANVAAAGGNKRGGGIIVTAGTVLNLYNSIVTGNVADEGEDIFNWDTVNMQNTLYGNYTKAVSPDHSPTLNAIDSRSGIIATSLFTSFVNADYTLKSASPAINGGNDQLYHTAFPPSIPPITHDLTGNDRIRSGQIDIGAQEF